jgi:hypothetical protein
LGSPKATTLLHTSLQSLRQKIKIKIIILAFDEHEHQTWREKQT